MKCFDCKYDFAEKDIHESHDVPRYLFEGNKKGQKNQADKWGRHWLCKKCHHNYEKQLRIYLQDKASQFAERFFNGK